jgi:hypothetical protein
VENKSGLKVKAGKSYPLFLLGDNMPKFIEGFLFGAGFTLAYIIITRLAMLIGLH